MATGEGWGDIPVTWEKCEKHGWAASKGPCPYCERFAIVRLVALAHVAKITGVPSTVRTYVEGWLARSDEVTVTKILTDPWSRGKTVMEMQTHWFPPENPERGGGKSWEELMP